MVAQTDAVTDQHPDALAGILGGEDPPCLAIEDPLRETGALVAEALVRRADRARHSRPSSDHIWQDSCRS
jgi:hypothetical protein